MIKYEVLLSPNRWAYSGFAVQTHDSGEYRYVRRKVQRNRERITVRGLNDNHNKDLKSLFKSAAISASTRPGPLRDFYMARVADDGASDTGTQDCCDQLNDVEERSGFRSTKLASASSLSISGEEGFPSLAFSPLVVSRVLEMLGSRGVSVNEIGPVCFGTESPISRYALSDNQK